MFKSNIGFHAAKLQKIYNQLGGKDIPRAANLEEYLNLKNQNKSGLSVIQAYCKLDLKALRVAMHRSQTLKHEVVQLYADKIEQVLKMIYFHQEHPEYLPELDQDG